ncbi:MAG: aconitate hydratase [Candidatus Krumholzibacteriia bacterium]
MASHDPFHARDVIDTPLGRRAIYRLDALTALGPVDSLPYSIKVLLEACLRNLDGYVVTEDHVRALAGYDARHVGETEIPFMPGRVVLQDFTGVPAVVDLAAMRAAMVRMTGDEDAARKVNPLVPCDLVIDHSVQVDAFASERALFINAEKEFERNHERYRFLKWGQQAFDNFRVVPPATGIVHQVNLEYLARVVWDGQAPAGREDGTSVLYPDSLVGTDSHTTMINGLGVLGWGVGGIEAEAVMLGQPIYMLVPEVVGFRLTGALPEGATATDLVLRVTQMLREVGVVGRFVEFHGQGLAGMPLANRATIANMAPEYGATVGFFPVDEQTLTYLRLTGRSRELIDSVEQYCKAQGLWREDGRKIHYTETLELDLSTVIPSLAGPKRPQDRIALSDMKRQWTHDLEHTFDIEDTTSLKHNPVGGWVFDGGQPGGQTGNTPDPDHPPVQAAPQEDRAATTADRTATVDRTVGLVEVEFEGRRFGLTHGAVVIAAITSCTNTSNPDVMMAAGLVARKARERGLSRQPWVKTSLAPGSKVVTDYYRSSGLMEDLEALGFHLVGYGCTTCIGNSGPLPEPISRAINTNGLVAAAVLSGNRNFEGRISPDVRANYLASPPLVVAYAIAGSVNVDLTRDPIGRDRAGNDVFLRDIWPTQEEVATLVREHVKEAQFHERYANVFEGTAEWRDIDAPGGRLYAWEEQSTYVQEPPFFVGLSADVPPVRPIIAARCLVKVGDSVTTDHISPAGSIKKDSPAGRWLLEHGVEQPMFNSYGSRRGNDRVMVRGTFANVRVRNQLAPGTEGGFTTDFTRHAGIVREPEQASTIFDAAVAYGSCRTSDPELVAPPATAGSATAGHRRGSEPGTPLVVIAGADYGMGSSRDWAAKGTYLLGVRAVIARSFERIHRSNLVGMGVLPLVFADGESADSLALTGEELFDIEVPGHLKPRQELQVTARHPGTGRETRFTTIVRIDTPVEAEYYRNGGILPTVLRRMATVIP